MKRHYKKKSQIEMNAVNTKKYQATLFFYFLRFFVIFKGAKCLRTDGQSATQKWLRCSKI